jgi:hypothetical protein
MPVMPSSASLCAASKLSTSARRPDTSSTAIGIETSLKGHPLRQGTGYGVLAGLIIGELPHFSSGVCQRTPVEG